ncbi:MAG: LamG domain-containing protein, partial [Candidatus Marinimicrobia bacterium]|nr:LamG domain-containing protein [Candidatus Neomarinimicrobiota bacterium]
MKNTKLVLGVMLILGLATGTSLMAANNSLDFDGSDDNVNCGTIDLSGSAITLQAWIKPGSFKSASPYISNIVGEEASGHTALLRLGDAALANNKLQFVLNIGSSETKLDGSTALSADVWYHVAATYDGSNMRIYINGIEDASQAQTGSFTANTTFYISYPSGGTRAFDGQIDEVRAWNTARSQTNIRQGMYREMPTESTMILYYKFNETTGTTTDNAEGTSAYDGTLNGSMTNDDWVTSPAFFGPKNNLDFDGGTIASGSPDYASKSSNVTSNTDNFTMMAWAKPDVVSNGSGGWRCIAYNGDDAGGWGIGIESSKVTGLFGAIKYNRTNEVLTADNWYHITMRRSSGTVQFFLNGELLDYSDATAPNSPSSNFTIGNM